MAMMAAPVVHFNTLFCLDTRSLAIFRIGLGLTILYNLYDLFPKIDAFFGSYGIAPLSYAPPALPWCLHALNEHHWYIVFLFSLHALFALMLTLGIRTQLSVFICWVLSVSLSARTPIINGGNDMALNTLLFWGLFLPLGNHFRIGQWSTDQNKVQPPTQIMSMAAFAFIVQLIVIYLFDGYLKTHPSWTKEYTALSYIFSSHEFSKPLGNWLLQFPDFLKILTFVTLILEKFGILLLLIPWRKDFLRGLIVVSFVAFHYGIFLTIDVGWFSSVMIAAWCALIPSSWWGAKPHQKSITTNIFKLKGIVLLSLLAFFISLNVIHANTLQGQKASGWRKVLNLAAIAGLDQFWYQFSSPPLITQTFYFAPVFDQMGKNTIMSYPPFDMQEFKQRRWKKFLTTLNNPKSKKYHYLLSAYLTRRWNNEHPAGPKAKTTNIYIQTKHISLNKNPY